MWSLRHQWFISANVIFFSSVSDERRMQHPCCDRWWHVGCRTALSPATQQNMANSNLYSCRSVMPKNVLASLALQFSRCSAASYIANFSLKSRKIALAPLTADIQMCPVPPPCCVHPSVTGIQPIRYCNLCLSKREWLLHSRQLKLDPCAAHHCQLQPWVS